MHNDTSKKLLHKLSSFVFVLCTVPSLNAALRISSVFRFFCSFLARLLSLVLVCVCCCLSNLVAV